MTSTKTPDATRSSHSANGKTGRFPEPAKDLPLFSQAEVIVCGAGPAGVAAAIAAARGGAKTHLFEVHACLGGVWTAGLLTYIFDFDKPGLTSEIRDRLDRRGARRGENIDRFSYEPEEMKVVLEEMCLEAGVVVHLQERVVAAFRDGRRLTTIVTESRSGRRAWQAGVFIDATGDGDLGALAGCQWETGKNGPGSPCQPWTLNALAVVRDADALGEFISFFQDDDMDRHVRVSEALRRELLRAGHTSSYGMPTIFHVHGNLVMTMFNHEYGVFPSDSDDFTSATLQARAEVHRLVRALESLGGPWEGIRLVATAEQIGIREGRRIRGRYTLGRDDLIEGRSFPDGVTRVTFGPDIHALTPEENAEGHAVTHGGVSTKAYEIPLRSLIAQDVDGLMMAGRCISGDFLAHSSYRVTGDAVATGEAAGAVAAQAARSGRLPHEVAWSDIAAPVAAV